MLDLDPSRDAAPPREAATVVLVRDRGDAAGLEVFCVERNKASRFLGGAIVFPGGKVDPDDADPRWRALATDPRAPHTESFGAGDRLRAYAVAALRESLEEAALLPLEGGALTDAELRAVRAEVAAGTTTLDAFLAARGLRIDASALVPFARWITPVAESRRFDTRFFLAVAPAGQSGAHDERETMASFWAPASDVLARFGRGEIQLAPPTYRGLEILAPLGRAADAIAAAEAACLEPICPRLVEHADERGATFALVLPGDPEHEIRDARSPGHSRFVLRGDRWLPEAPPRVG